MQVVILCGGKGTRLFPQTANTPKSMVRINGIPFLEYVVRYLKSQHCYNILLLIGYLGDHIENYFQDGEKFGLKITYCREATPLGTGGALKNASWLLEDVFFLLFGDTYFPISYQELQAYHLSQPVAGTITVYNNKNKRYVANISLHKNNLIWKYNKYNSEGMTHVDAGVAILKKTVLKRICADQFSSLEEDIYPELIQMDALNGFPVDQPFYDMGTPRGLKQLQCYLDSQF